MSVGIDWDSLKDSLQPPTISDDAWNAVFANFVTLVGNTLGSYQAALDDIATYLSTLGQYTADVTQLQSIAYQIADNFGAISERNTLGQFGWGVFGTNDIQVQSTPDGDVVVTSGNQQRFFFPDAPGSTSFSGEPGDTGTAILNAAANTFVVREADGTTSTYAVTLSAGAITSGSLAKTQDPNGNTVTYTATSATNSFGDTTTYITNAQGNLVVTDFVGRVTTYVFDADKNLLSVTNAAGTTSFTYVPGSAIATEHAIASITFPDGSHEYFEYDDLGRLIQTHMDGNADPVTYSYPQIGQVVITDAGRACNNPVRQRIGPARPRTESARPGHGVGSVRRESKRAQQVSGQQGEPGQHQLRQPGGIPRSSPIRSAGTPCR